MKQPVKKRKSLHLFGNEEKIVNIIESDTKMHDQWGKYQKKFAYASDISFEKAISCVKVLISMLKAN